MTPPLKSPTSSYCGLTVVLSQPSRNDLLESDWLVGKAGWYFREIILKQKCSIDPASVEYRLSSAHFSTLPLRPDTTGVLLLGDRAFREWTKVGEYDDYNLDEQRGCPLRHNLPNQDILMIASYTPQDCMDRRNYEAAKNPLLRDEKVNQDEDEANSTGDDTSGESSEAIKHKGKSRRENYRFWLFRDLYKLRRSMSFRGCTSSIQHRIRDIEDLSFVIYPSSTEISKYLRTCTSSSFIYLDIETDSYLNITVFSVAIDDGPIFVIPWTRYDYTPAYSQYNSLDILRALCFALVCGRPVCHNGMFDLLILAWRYRLHFSNRCYDTMLAHHRCWPEAEKSLGHAMSHLTMMEYHKDEGVFEPKNRDQERKLWTYNGKDVEGMRQVKKALDEHCEQDEGLQASIAQANGMIRPYIIMTLTGMAYDEDVRKGIMRENDRLMTKYVRVLRHLLGEATYSAAAKGSSSAMPGSNAQCVRYFHGMLNYGVVARSEKTREPSLAKDSMLSLKLKYPHNAAIDFCLAYRRKAKESGSLKFNNWTGPDYNLWLQQLKNSQEGGN